MLFNPIPRQKPYCTLADFVIFLRMFFGKHLIRGKHVQAFETRFACQYGMAYALTMGSCRSGFDLILEALSIGPGDEVILPAFNLCAFPKILKLRGIKPVFVDIDAATFTLDAQKIEGEITAKTKAIVAVHLFGNACDMNAIMSVARRRGLHVIEDCANAHLTKYQGRYVGTYGDVACFSLGHSKDVPTFGGGIVLTDDEALYTRMVRTHEVQFVEPTRREVAKTFLKNLILKLATLKFVFLLFVYPILRLCTAFGFDPVDHFIEERDEMITAVSKRKLSNVQARIGLVKLDQDNAMQRARICVARRLSEGLAELKNVSVSQMVEGGGHAYWNYPVLFSRRGPLVKGLLRHGIDARCVTNYNCNRFKIFQEYKQDCPVTAEISDKMITLPIYHYLTDREIGAIKEAMKMAVSRLV